MKINNSQDFLYCHTTNKIMRPKQEIFEFYDSAKSNKIGTLVCHKSDVPLRPNYDGSVLAIDFLEVSNKNQGLGTKILKFAADYSTQVGCDGYLTVKADGSFMPERIPHIFYRKYGFTTFDKRNDIKLNKFIKKGCNATTKDFPCMLMHYPPQPKDNMTFIQKFAKTFQKLFKF